jgi:hypothetical protein
LLVRTFPFEPLDSLAKPCGVLVDIEIKTSVANC